MVMLMRSKYRVIGIMSGTSLDGLDIAYCVFENRQSGWKYSIEQSSAVKYSPKWLSRLSRAHTLAGADLMALDADFGAYLGDLIRNFVLKHRVKVDFIASHGHTVFHQPENGFTTQIGNGYSMAVASGLPVVYDFRMLDVALGGEGAPLVPVGDKFLFNEYDVCLNMGGIANLSLDVKGKRLAYDICFCNTPLNILAAEASMKFDRNGTMAAGGSVDKKLLTSLTKLYQKYRTRRPSLGREIFEKHFARMVAGNSVSLEDRLATFTESAAIEICRAIKSHRSDSRVLCTGGGAFNSFLISRMLEHGGDELAFIIPDEQVVKFKEAMVFGFLGVLRVRNEINCLKSVTSADRDSSGGTMIGFN